MEDHLEQEVIKCEYTLIQSNQNVTVYASDTGKLLTTGTDKFPWEWQICAAYATGTRVCQNQTFV